MSAAESIRIDVPKSVIVQLLLERLDNLGAPPAFTRTNAPPAIGEAWQGGLYGGLTIHDNAPHGLILLPGEFEGGWNPAREWADKQRGILPARIDQLVLLMNLKKEFKEAAYWSGEQHASDPRYAWMQIFDNGSQNVNYVGFHFRARAVRRVPCI